MKRHLISGSGHDAFAACDRSIADRRVLVAHVGNVTCKRCLKFVQRLYSSLRTSAVPS